MEDVCGGTLVRTFAGQAANAGGNVALVRSGFGPLPTLLEAPLLAAALSRTTKCP